MIKELQTRLGLSTEQMSVYLGVSHHTIIKWSNGQRKVPAIALRLIDVLGTVEALNPALHEHLTPK